MPSGGIECNTCKRTRAPTLAECPWCRASAPDDLGEERAPSLLEARDDVRSFGSLPSRLLLVTLPLLALVVAMEMTSARGPALRHGYAWGGALVGAIGLLAAALIAAAIGWAIDRLGRRIRIDGQAPHRVVIALVATFGILPAVWMPVDRAVDDWNAGSGRERVMVPCTWSEAHQLLDAHTHAVLHVSVDATCETPSGTVALDVSLDPASGAGEGGRFTIGMWPGRIAGWLYTRDAIH